VCFGVRAVPGKMVCEGGTELENWDTKNTILSFLWYNPYRYSRKHPPTHRILIDFRSTPDALPNV